MDKGDIRKQAQWEVDLERFEKAVEEEKERIRAGKWYDRLLPFTIEIKRK